MFIRMMFVVCAACSLCLLGCGEAKKTSPEAAQKVNEQEPVQPEE